jgi:Zn-dependent peptidase ImmA (M78 family)
MFHMLKHTVDHPVLYAHVPASRQDVVAQEVGAYFAGCSIVPGTWLEAAWQGGMQATDELARHFKVSSAVIEQRLTQVGLRRHEKAR